MREDSLQILYRLKPNVRAAFSKIETITNRINELEKRIVVQRIPVTQWQYRTCIYQDHNVYDPLQDWKAITIGEKWGGDEVTGFFKVELTVPKKTDGANLFLDLDFGGEALLSINGTPYQGLDFDRQLVPIGDNFAEGQKLSLSLEVSVRNPPYDAFRDDIKVYHLFQKADLVQIDTKIENLYYDSWVVYDVINDSPEGEYRQFLLSNLDLALHEIDFYQPDHGLFLECIARAQHLIRENIYKNQSFKKNGSICIVGQSHLDLVYLWPYKEFLRKNPRTAMNMIRLFEEFPEFVFSQSQAKLYLELKDKFPEVYAMVKTKISAGNWEPIGAFYVEPDCNLPSGESLIRQIMFGKQFYQKEFGVDPQACWVPDVFGCMGTMPQILKRSGVNYMSTIKLSIWNDTNPFPYNSFWWEGPDGSKVLAHFPATHFVASVEPKKICENWNNYKEKHLTGESLYQFGLADGGGGATRDMVAKMHRIKNFPGIPEMHFDTITNFFKRLEQNSAELPVWQDELYLETHRGTYTTKGQIKRANRKGEFLLRSAELFSVLAQPYEGGSRKKQIDSAWEKILVNQFHDIIPGSHVNQTVADSMKLYDDAFAIAAKEKNESLDTLANNIACPHSGKTAIVFNSLSWKRNSEIEFSLAATSDDFTLIDSSDGSEVPYSSSSAGSGILSIACFVKEIPAMGYKTIKIVSGKAALLPPRATIDKNVIETPQFRLEIDADGNLSSIFDKQFSRELTEAGVANKFQIFEDIPGRYSAWDIIPTYKENEFTDIEHLGMEVVENSYLRTILLFKKRILHSIVEQKVVMYHDLHRIDFQTHINWQEREKLLKVCFPVSVRARNATCDIPFGTIQRPTHQSTSWDRAKFEFCAHKWVDLSEADFGVALLNDCKYGYDVVNNRMRLTLLKAPIYPDPVSDVGEHDFTYSIYPHHGDWKAGRVMQEGYAVNVPLDVRIQSTHSGPLPQSGASLFNVSSDNLIIETVKEPESDTTGAGAVIRMYDVYGQRGKASLKTLRPVWDVIETNLMEKRESLVDSTGNSFNFSFRPFEIKTFIIK